MFEKLRLWWKIKRADYVIMLDGRPGAGKDTLLKIINGEGFDPKRKATPKSVEKKTIKLEEKRCCVYNTAGSNSMVAEKSIEREKLPKGKTLWIEVFDMGKYDKLNKNTSVSLVEEIQARYEEARDRGFKFLAFGTHLNTNQDKKERIKNDLEGKRIQVLFYELSENPQKEIIELIKDLYNEL